MKTQTHKFSVNIPNPTEKAIDVVLSLKAASSKDISLAVAPELAENKLRIRKAGISLDSCANATKKSIKIRLQPFSSTQAYIRVETLFSKKQEIAGVHLVDTRKNKVVGGVLLICSSKPLTEAPGTVLISPNACPAVLAKNLYAIKPGKDITKPRLRAIPSGEEVELVAQITNPTSAALQNTKAYLEHLGGADTEFEPGTWNIGTLDKGETFFATWKVRSKTWLTGYFEPSIVVASQSTEPTRLTDKILFANSSRDR